MEGSQSSRPPEKMMSKTFLLFKQEQTEVKWYERKRLQRIHNGPSIVISFAGAAQASRREAKPVIERNSCGNQKYCEQWPSGQVIQKKTKIYLTRNGVRKAADKIEKHKYTKITFFQVYWTNIKKKYQQLTGKKVFQLLARRITLNTTT